MKKFNLLIKFNLVLLFAGCEAAEKEGRTLRKRKVIKYFESDSENGFNTGMKSSIKKVKREGVSEIDFLNSDNSSDYSSNLDSYSNSSNGNRSSEDLEKSEDASKELEDLSSQGLLAYVRNLSKKFDKLNNTFYEKKGENLFIIKDRAERIVNLKKQMAKDQKKLDMKLDFLMSSFSESSLKRSNGESQQKQE